MIVYQLGPEGYFAGLVTADDSPLEPGVFLIPGGCVEIAPPAFDASEERARWTADGWLIEAIPRPEPEPEPQLPPAEQPEPEPFDLKAYIGKVRRVIEEQGVVLPSGVVVHTDVESQGKVAQAIQSIDLGLIEEPVKWKAKSGFVLLSRADLLEVGRAVAQHVQRSFDAEEVVTAQYEAGSLDATAQIDAAFVTAMSPAA